MSLRRIVIGYYYIASCALIGIGGGHGILILHQLIVRMIVVTGADNGSYQVSLLSIANENHLLWIKMEFRLNLTLGHYGFKGIRLCHS